MIWFALAMLAAAAVAPLAWSLRRTARAIGRREADVALHRAQLAELDRDLAEGRIAPAEHAAAVLEVQRRLLAAAEPREQTATDQKRTGPRSRTPLIATALLIPIAALLLYLPGGHPELPAQPLAERMAKAEQRMRQAAALIGELRQQLATLDPHSERAREGYVLLGNFEDASGNLPEAAAAWRKALDVRFDSTLAAQAAEAITRMHGSVTPEAAALFRRALAEAPADAPWRAIAEQRLAEANRQ
ncbi:MAG: c-type cytochrome biogenesis protein CcmI [Alphaproteobacteria bacterium]|nr:c-type cytochrome biogenesis protein CcmI [Alphaproteobacteria bacterium]